LDSWLKVIKLILLFRNKYLIKAENLLKKVIVPFQNLLMIFIARSCKKVAAMVFENDFKMCHV
jgi:hypothetical protein